MTLIPYPPRGVFKALRRYLHRALTWPAPLPVREAGDHALGPWATAVDINEGVEGLLLRVEIPGVDPGEIELTPGPGILALRGERGQDRASPDGEAGPGLFFRQFALPDDLDIARLSSQCRNGVLEVWIPRTDH
ncbi:MAG: Hsp20/alpha crystallin family protein [Gammaproteobacteria bacterium]|nr:Hsp20/alpha crystallin family protein [Gammaproteobacteria bacterium]